MSHETVFPAERDSKQWKRDGRGERDTHHPALGAEAEGADLSGVGVLRVGAGGVAASVAPGVSAEGGGGAVAGLPVRTGLPQQQHVAQVGDVAGG